MDVCDFSAWLPSHPDQTFPGFMCIHLNGCFLLLYKTDFVSLAIYIIFLLLFAVMAFVSFCVKQAAVSGLLATSSSFTHLPANWTASDTFLITIKFF